MSKETTPQQRINEAIKGLRKQFGDDVIMSNDDNGHAAVEALSTGCYSIDTALGCGGLPKGRVIEVFGEESSGKTSLTLFFISQVQKNGGICAFIDAEHAFNRSFATAIGVDVDKLLVSQPSTLEEAMETVRALALTNAIDLIVLDSVAALVPKKELEGEEMLKDSVAEQARLMSKSLRILTGEIARSKTVAIFINQLRDKVGVFFGNKDTTPGGKALKFYSSIRMKVLKGQRITKDGDIVGNAVKMRVVKNKVGPPWRECEFDLIYTSGVDLAGDLLEAALFKNIIEKNGNTLTFGSHKLGVGKEQAKETIRNQQDLAREIRAALDAAGGYTGGGGTQDGEDADNA